jgi:hypothetical protein
MNQRKDPWYCVACKTSTESIAAEQLKRIQNLEVFVPLVRKTGKNRRAATMHKVALFPGYIFARVSPEQSLAAIRYTNNVIDVVRFGKQVPIVPEKVSEQPALFIVEQFMPFVAVPSVELNVAQKGPEITYICDQRSYRNAWRGMVTPPFNLDETVCRKLEEIGMAFGYAVHQEDYSHRGRILTLDI